MKQKRVILIAEDEELNRMLIDEFLSGSDLVKYYAKNGKEAVEIFQKKKVDIILMDLKMPVMDGFEATREIKKLNKMVPIIAQTAYSYKREDCLNAGFDDYISKPFEESFLINLLQKYL